EELVVLLERVGAVEGVLEEREAGPGDVEDVLGVEVLGERGPAVDAEGDGAAVGARELPGDAVVRAGDDRGDVAGDPRGRGEAPDRRGAVAVRGLRLGGRGVG